MRAHEARWPALENRDMSTPISDTSTSAERRPTPTIVCRRWILWFERLRDLEDADIASRDQRRQLIQLREHLPEEEGMVRRKPAAQRLRQRLHLRGEAALRQLGQRLRIGFSGDQRV